MSTCAGATEVWRSVYAECRLRGSYFVQCLIQVGDDVVGMLTAGASTLSSIVSGVPSTCSTTFPPISTVIFTCRTATSLCKPPGSYTLLQ